MLGGQAIWNFESFSFILINIFMCLYNHFINMRVCVCLCVPACKNMQKQVGVSLAKSPHLSAENLTSPRQSSMLPALGRHKGDSRVQHKISAPSPAVGIWTSTEDCQPCFFDSPCLCMFFDGCYEWAFACLSTMTLCLMVQQIRAKEHDL